MPVPGSSHVYYINGQQVHPEIAVDIAGTTDAVLVKLTRMEMGTPNKEITEEKRSIGDGMQRRGAQWGGRDFAWTVTLEENTAVLGDDPDGYMWEGIRDDALDWLDRLLNLGGGLITLRVDRMSVADGGIISRVIQAEAKTLSGWDWQGDWTTAAPGSYGGCDGPRGFNQPIAWHAPFPWWQDKDFIEVDLGLVDYIGAFADIDNDGAIACGTQFGFTRTAGSITDVEFGISGGGDIVPVNLSGGLQNLAGVVGASEFVYDYNMTDPLRFMVRAGGASGVPGDIVIRDHVTPGSDRMILPLGVNPDNSVVAATVTGGPSAAAQVYFRYRRWYRNP